MRKPNQKSLQTWKLKDSIDKKLIDLDAPYQRGIVWESDKMSDLIDSLLYNFYVPPLVFAVKKTGNKSLRTCVDGKQRLTSITRFMNNEIPYYDRSVEPPIPKYFSFDLDRSKPDGDVVSAGRQYLSDDEVHSFQQVELICVEYTQLTEDDEYEVFSRVQKGVQISPAEKLRAHNTAVAKKIRELSDRYTDVSQILPSLGNLAVLFKTIAEFFVCLDSEPEQYRSKPSIITDYIKSTGTLKASVVERAEKALLLLKRMINYHVSFWALTRYPAQLKKNMVRLELLALLYYLSGCNQNRSLDDLAEDCNDMRATFHNWNQKLYLGTRSWQFAVSWCRQKWLDNERNGNNNNNTSNNNNNNNNNNNVLIDDKGDGLFLQNNEYLFGNPIQYPETQSQQSFLFNEANMDFINSLNTLATTSARRGSRNDRPVAKRGRKITRLN